MLAAVDFQNPLLWAIMIGWIMSVVLHEFAHGLVASWGGDYTIRERGGLTLNPLQYVDPVMSLLLPAIFAGLKLSGLLFLFYPVPSTLLWLGPAAAWAEGLTIALLATARVSLGEKPAAAALVTKAAV